jgi:hypothetical protein
MSFVNDNADELESQRKIRRQQKAALDDALMQDYRAAIVNTPGLIRSEMNVLCGLLDLFAAPLDDLHGESKFWDKYADWWYTNQCLIPDLIKRLETLSRDLFTTPQIRQLLHVLHPAILIQREMTQPLLLDEIKTVMHKGFVHFHFLPGMNVAVMSTIYGECELGSCRQVLHDAIAAMET